jgi:hypothetical protein
MPSSRTYPGEGAGKRRPDPLIPARLGTKGLLSQVIPAQSGGARNLV